MLNLHIWVGGCMLSARQAATVRRDQSRKAAAELLRKPMCLAARGTGPLVGRARLLPPLQYGSASLVCTDDVASTLTHSRVAMHRYAWLYLIPAGADDMTV